MVYKFKLTVVLGLFILIKSNAQSKNTYPLNAYNIEVIGDLNGFALNWQTENVNNGVDVATITLTHPTAKEPPQLILKWSTPSANVAGYWSTAAFLDKTITPDWGPAKVKSMLSRHSPVICLFGHNDVNRQTFAVSEALNTVITSTSVKEENGMMYNEIQLFTEKHKAITTYSVKLRLDTRPINYATALNDVNTWWESFKLYQPLSVPPAAKLPVYSTWYSYHQNVSGESILKECQQAKAMGYETIIVDDGWQTLDSNRGYAYTGDWKPERLTDMKDLVQEVHELGMKFVLWYAVPFVGEKSEAYKKLQGKFLSYWNGQGTYVLDPRYPEVRDFIINTYLEAVEAWNLDGFKLDFIGRFRAVEDTQLVAENGRDYASVNEATDRLMTDLLKSLRTIKPDILIEFRQPYTGPLMKKYGNMLRASDCPNVAVINRVETTDLRLVSGETAVHADMLMWHYSEPVEVAALQFLNVLFSVPQISVRLADIPEAQFNMIRFYTEYWLKNRETLLDGEFLPENPQANYPIISGVSKTKKITALYGKSTLVLEADTPKQVDVINAKMSEEVIVLSKQDDAVYHYEIKDCQGNSVKKGETTITTGANLFEVPVSGLVSFQRK